MHGSPPVKGLGLACAHSTLGGTCTSARVNHVPRGTTLPITPRMAAETDAPPPASRPPQHPPSISPTCRQACKLSCSSRAAIASTNTTTTPRESRPIGELCTTKAPTFATPEWDLPTRLVLLSHDVPPHLRPLCPSDWCRQGSLYPLAPCLLLLSHNIETNPRPPTCRMHLLTLNVGGPHLNRKRWGQTAPRNHNIRAYGTLSSGGTLPHGAVHTWRIQCNAILVAGCVQSAMPLYALVHEKEHVRGDIIVEQRQILRVGACCGSGWWMLPCNVIAHELRKHLSLLQRYSLRSFLFGCVWFCTIGPSFLFQAS